MNIVFLDIDGVLNHGGLLRGGTDMQNYGFDQYLVDNLKSLINEFNLKVVISSSWRMSDSINSEIIGGSPWTKILESKLNLPNIIIDKIGFEHEYHHYWVALNPNKPSNHKIGQYRGWDIIEWLKINSNVTKFVILDDYVSESDISKCFPNNYVRCNHGFDLDALYRAREILRKE